MKARQPMEAQAAAFEQPSRAMDRRGRADQLRGCYTIGQICALLNIKRRTFYDLKDAGQLPFLEELQPRLGRLVRYRAALVDAYLDNRLNRTA